MSKRSNRSSPAKKSWLRRVFSFKRMALLFAIFLIAMMLVLLFLDVRVRSEFEGKRWELPAKVFARPLELYQGAPISLGDLRIELQALGYQFVETVSVPGQAAFNANSATLATRGFIFPDDREPPRDITLRFNGSSVTKLEALDGNSLTLLRLEPALIGGIYPLNNEDRDLVQLAETPQALIEALIAIEDRDYYQHFGISPRGIARAMWANIRAGAFVQGGSTLTQQLIKNFYLTSDRTLLRKLLEIPMAILLESHYSKQEILEAYLNEVYLGQSGNRAIHGFQLGAAHYFAQPLQELQLHQLALMAGMIKGPSYYDPRRNPQRATQRRNLVLSVLHQQGSISEAAYQRATEAPLDVVKAGTSMKEAFPAYLDLVKRQLRRDYRDEDLGSEGLRVLTSLDPISQFKAEKALSETLQQLKSRYGEVINTVQGSMVVTDPQTGEVLAVIGDRNTRQQGFNRALDAQRPIGSLVKPAVYLTALEQGYTLMTPLDDSPYSLSLPNQPAWQPQNFERQSHGKVVLQQALSKSYNIATARLGMDLGLDKVIDTMHRLGVDRQIDPYPSLLLGAQSLSTLEVATMYQTIAANGFQIAPRTIRTVTDSKGQALSSYPFDLTQSIDAKAMYLLQTNLIDVTRTGTARSLTQRLPKDFVAAGKTGTSNDQRDSWFAGFTGNRLAVVWLGADSNTALPFTGSSGALQVWSNYIQSEPLQAYQANPPEGVESFWVDPLTFERADENCAAAVETPFIVGTEPTNWADCATSPLNDSTDESANPIERSVDWIRGLFR